MKTVKEYSLFKTAKKTATTNNLIMLDKDVCGNIVLLDMELMNELPLEEYEINNILKHAKYICASNHELFYGAVQDNFTCFNGYGKFYTHRVFNKDNGKRLYCIMQLIYLKHSKGERKNVYDNYKSYTHEVNSRYSIPQIDVEI